MSTTAELVLALKQELKAADMTYADLAQALGMAESSVKRMLSKGNMSLSHVDAVCRAIKIDFSASCLVVPGVHPSSGNDQESIINKRPMVCKIVSIKKSGIGLHAYQRSTADHGLSKGRRSQ